MLKKIFFILAVVLAPALLFAAEGVIDKDSQAYKDIKTLVDAKTITVPLDKEQLSRVDVVKYINNAVESLRASPPADESAKGQIETVYNLIKSYETDMMEQGQKLSDIQDAMVDLKIMEERLGLKEIKDRQDKLFSSIGMKINGEAMAYMTDLLLYGGDMTGKDLRYKPITQYLDLKFSAHSGRDLYAEATFRLENLFGGLWGAQDIYGLRNYFISGNFPVNFTLGDFKEKLTPFTVWAEDDDRHFESKIFSDKRQMNMEELYLGDNSWPLTGGTAGYKTGIYGASADFDVFGARLEEAGKSNYEVAPGFSQAPGALFTYQHDQYMWGGRIETDATLKDILKIGGNFVEIRDIKDSWPNGSVTAPLLDNYVSSADAEISLMGIAKLKSEFAVSNYYVGNQGSPYAWQNKYISDSAFNCKIVADYFDTKLEAEYLSVGNSFTAYAAQSRIYDYYNNFDYLTQNSTWNVSQPIPTYIISGKVYPFTRYNNCIVTDYFATGANMMPYVFYENASAPDGDSTPNRQGINIRLSGKYLNDMIEPYIRYSNLTELVSYLPGSQYTCPPQFEDEEAGAKIKIGDLKVNGGFKRETTDNTYTGGNVWLESHITDAGADYTLFQKLTLSVGYREIYFTGSEYPYTYSTTDARWEYGSSLTNYDNDIVSYGAGIDYEVVKDAIIGISYTNTVIDDRLKVLSNAVSFSAQEIDAKAGFKF